MFEEGALRYYVERLFLLYWCRTIYLMRHNRYLKTTPYTYPLIKDWCQKLGYSQLLTVLLYYAKVTIHYEAKNPHELFSTINDGILTYFDVPKRAGDFVHDKLTIDGHGTVSVQVPRAA